MTAAAQKLVDVKDVMAELNISRTTVYQLIKDGRLDRVRLGSRALITRASIDRLVESLPVG